MSNKHPVDARYREWFQGAAPSASAREALRARILNNVRTAADPAVKPDPKSTRQAGGISLPLLPRWAWAALFLTAVLSGTQVLRRVAGRSTQPPPLAQPGAESADATATAEQTLFQGLADLFGEDAIEWIAKEEGHLRFGVADLTDTTESAQPPVRARVALTQREPGGQWRTLWQADVIVKAGRMVDIEPASMDHVRLQIWAMPNPDGSVVFDTSLSVGGGLCLFSHQSGVAAAGVAVELPAATRYRGGLRVLQTLLPLKESAG